MLACRPVVHLDHSAPSLKARQACCRRVQRVYKDRGYTLFKAVTLKCTVVQFQCTVLHSALYGTTQTVLHSAFVLYMYSLHTKSHNIRHELPLLLYSMLYSVLHSTPQTPFADEWRTTQCFPVPCTVCQTISRHHPARHAAGVSSGYSR